MKTTTISLFIAALFIVASCVSSEKLVADGNYDKAIEKSIKKILKSKAKIEDYKILDKAYTLATARDNDYLKQLEAEQLPENWGKMYHVYVKLDNRQNQIKKVIPFSVGNRVVDYEMVDYTTLKANAKLGAANYHYENGKRFLSQNNKSDARSAYYQFLKVKDYTTSAFPDINELIREAKIIGTTYVNIDVANNTQHKLSPRFYDEILNLELKNYEKKWVDYTMNQDDTQSDIAIIISVNKIVISPERYTTKEYVREKTVEDGFDYVLDKKGNVKKDSLGNDIKTIRYKKIKCFITETIQHKQTSAHAEIEYFNIHERSTFKRIPVSKKIVFQRTSARADGDYKALTAEDLELIKKKPVPFPSDHDMLLDCARGLSSQINITLKEHKNLIK
ncbi:MAG: hypothetical protein MI922_15965 [Bacteroidales bacterium]|nr:hypothetical protein [Bacteroidales bacterium]